MRKMMETGMVFFMAMMVLITQPVTADAKAKVLNKKMTIDLNMDSAGIRFAPTKLKKHFKVKVSVKNKKVLKAKAKGRKYISASCCAGRWRSRTSPPEARWRRSGQNRYG